MRAMGAAACWLIAGVAYVSFEFISATAIPGYRYGRDFISDLGRPDSPLSHLMNTAFVLQGTLFCAGAVVLVWATGSRASGLFMGFAAANAVGNVVVATVPSDGAGTAWVHVIGAVVAIVGGNAAILAGHQLVCESRWYRTASVVLAGLGLLSFGLLAVATTTSAAVVLSNAVWERASVYTIIGWQVLSACVLLSRRDRH